MESPALNPISDDKSATSNVKKRKRPRQPKKKDGQNRKARLIVRNLPFKTTEENLKEHLSKFGEIDEVKLLKKPDGKLVGCGFVQFRAVQMAAKALFNASGKPFMNRPIIIDWAVSKDKFKSSQALNTDVTVKEEPASDTEADVVVGTDVEVKSEDESDDDSKPIEDEDIKPSNSEDESDDGDEDIEIDEKPEVPQKFQSNDVSEGRTVFIKNVPFQATNADIKEVMQQFGRTFYALVCRDSLTEHSKGTAFVKFVESEAAEKCLQAGTELTLMGNILDCHPAVDKKSITEKTQKNSNEPKDSRNLYLIKEGVILAGTSAAEGVSKADMEQRLQHEQWKTQMLRNLNMFISRVRLVMHNLPATWDDAKLKALCMKYGGPKAFVKEAKVMRDLKNVDGQGIGKSKEFGFISFTNHENALTCLRALNNNPNIFTTTRRPIVSFSIENKAMVNAKQKRLTKSRMRNPTAQEYDPKLGKKENNSGRKPVIRRANKRPYPKPQTDASAAEKFTGVIAAPGAKKMRSRHNLRAQAQIHHETLKKERKSKFKKVVDNRNKEHIRQPKQKQNMKKENDSFNSLVNKYKLSLTTATEKKSKWYQ